MGMKVEPQLPGEGVLGPLPTPCRFITFNYVCTGTGVQSCFGLEDFFHLTVTPSIPEEGRLSQQA